MSMSRNHILYTKNYGGMSITNRLNPKPYTDIEKGAIILKNLNKKGFEILKDNSLCICGSGRKKENCHSLISKSSLVYLLWEKYLAFDNEVLRQTKEDNVKFYCEMNKCNKCCSDYFYISAIEYFTIKNDIFETKGIDYFNATVLKSNKMLSLLEKDYPSEFLKLENSNISLDKMFEDKENLKTFLKCPLLNENGLCDCYSSRPLICRFFGTSSMYCLCEDIEKQINNSNKANLSTDTKFLSKIKSKFLKKTHGNTKELENKIMVEIAYNENYQINIDKLEINKNNYIIQRPYPLFYFFANDKIFEKNYVLACKDSAREYILNQINLD